MLNCAHCVNFFDYSLFALPGPLLAYVREAAIVGLVTARSGGRQRWRKWGVGLLVAAAGFEAYWTATKEVLGRNGGIFMVRIANSRITIIFTPGSYTTISG